MTDKLKNLKLNLLFKELSLIESEQEYFTEFTNQYQSSFMEELIRCGYIPDDTPIEPPQVKEKDISLNINEIDLKLIKSLFRSIAKVSHPDKIHNTYRNQLYDKAHIAYQDNDLLTLCKIAKKLHIKIELGESSFLLFNDILKTKKKSIDNMKKSFLWMWVNSDTQEQKDNLVNTFIKNNSKK